LTDFFFFDYRRFVGMPLRVAVSIDGHDAATHDEIRGAGTFVRTTSNLRTLVNAGYDVEVTHTVTSRSLASFWNLVQLVKELGVRRLNLHKVSMQGNASDHRWLLVKPSEWIGFVSELTKLSTSSPSQSDLQIRYPILYTTRDKLDELMKAGAYYHHALGSFYSPDRGARIVLYPDQRLYISSELFGTGSYIGRIDDGVFVYNDSPINEREFFSKSPDLTIERLNPVFADEEHVFIPISVSYKSSAFA
jgi:MoaA/NifB/PqqE/SkfB family radical SAM enzyme